MTTLRGVRGVVRQDLADARRSRLLQAVLGLYVLFVGLLFAGVGLTAGQTVVAAVRITVLLGFLFVPLVALLAGYLAVAGERESGTLRLLLGYGLERKTVVLGKYLSRVGLVSAGLVAAFVVAGAVAVAPGLFPAPRLATVATFGGLTVAFAAAYVAVGVAVSTVAESRRAATTRTLAVYFVFTLFWSRAGPTTVPQMVGGVLDHLTGSPPSGWVWNVFRAASPAEAYFQALTLLPGDSLVTGTALRPLTLVGILLAWIVLPTALAALQFERVDVD